MAMPPEILQRIVLLWSEYTRAVSIPLVIVIGLTSLFSTLILIYSIIFLLAPITRAATPSEKSYVTSHPLEGKTAPKLLPCWYDAWLQEREAANTTGNSLEKHTGTIQSPEVEISVVIPAFNEEKRLEIMLEEAVEFLDAEYGRVPYAKEKLEANNNENKLARKGIGGYEILIVNDGSKDSTVDVALAFSLNHELHDVLRVCTLKENRGKGGAVTHGLRHVRGAYVIFADADGASRFCDLRKLVEGCKEVSDISGRAISVGSRAHLVGSEAVVKRSAIRNVLMHSFHLLLRLITPPATSRIRDTQCGFKLFTRAALPHIVPYMHAEGWIFDIEMLMLAESAPPAIVGKGENTNTGIRVKEVYIGWKEVDGSKLNVIWDSLGMAYSLALLRAGWMLGIYRRR